MNLTEKAAYIKGLADGVNYNKESADVKEEAPVAETKPVQVVEGEKANFSIQVTGEKKIVKGFYQFNGTDEHNNPVKLLFKKEEADDPEKIKWFPTFEGLAKTTGTNISFYGEKKNDCILFISNKKK